MAKTFIKKRKRHLRENVTDDNIIEYLGLDDKLTDKEKEDFSIDKEVFKSIFSDDFFNYMNCFDYGNNVAIQKIRNKINCIRETGYMFEKALQYGWQEVFKFKETRDDRVILVLDVNSQYPFAMTQDGYSNPRLLRVHHPRSEYDLDYINNGVALISFDIADEWFSKKFPRYFFDTEGRKYFKYKNLDYIWMNISEIKAYKKYMKNIHIKKIIYSQKSINHPLKGMVEYLYNKRLEYKGTIYEKVIKNVLVGIHSTTNGRDFEVCENGVKGFERVQEFLYQNCATIVRDEKDFEYLPNCSLTEHIRHKRSGKYIPVLTSEIYAKSRIGIFNLVDFTHTYYPEVEHCYTNIDSVHLSIPKSQYADFVEDLKRYGHIGDKLGQFKIEAVGDRGYWFCPGRYFIIKDERVVKYADIAIKNDDFMFNYKRDIAVKIKGRVVNHTHTVISGNNYKIIEGDDFIRPKWGEYINLERYKEKNRKITNALRFLKRNYISE